MSNQADHTIVRLRVPPEIKQKIEESAEKNNRSQSAEMVARLEQSFESNKPDPVFDDLLRVFREANNETMRLQAELIKIINEQKEEIEHLKKAP